MSTTKTARPSVALLLQRAGWFNAERIAEAHDKDAKAFFELPWLKGYLEALVEDMELWDDPDDPRTELIITLLGGAERGTWLHPAMAVPFARWLSPGFAACADEFLNEPPTTASAQDRAHHRWRMGEIEHWRQWFRDTFGCEHHDTGE
ncbi:hypothetical protein D9M68_378420 [compost metagenome]